MILKQRYVGEQDSRVTEYDIALWKYNHGGMDVGFKLRQNFRTGQDTLIMHTVESEENNFAETIKGE